MKINILFFSTRLIGEDGTILKMANPKGYLSSKIGGYFLDVSQEELKRFLPEVSSCDISKADFHEKVKELSSEFFYRDKDYLKKLQYDQIEDAKGILLKLLEKSPNPELERYLKGLNLTGKPNLPDFTKEHFKDEAILAGPAVNINLDKGNTMRDRLTLYTLWDERMETGERTLVYAVWPLGVSDKDEKDNGGNHKSKWVDCLTDAVIEEMMGVGADGEIQIILLLHDHDLASSIKTPFKTLYPFQPYGEKCKRALAVFQHSNSYFREIIKPKEGGAKAVFEKAKKIVENDVKFNYLKKLSDAIATYRGKDNNNNLKEALSNLEQYNIHIPIIIPILPNEGEAAVEIENLIYANTQVNAEIMNLRTKGVEK